MIEDIYNIIYINQKRYYKIDLNVRLTDFEYSTPYILEIDNYEIKETSWNAMILKLASFLNKYNPKSREELLQIRNDWGKQSVFDEEPKSNYKEFDYGLFINVNHNSVHAVWTLQLLLKEWKIDLSRCKLYIHRQPKGEKYEVIKYYTDKTINNLREFLQFSTSMQLSQINKIVDLLTLLNEKICPKLFNHSGYDNILVLDDNIFYAKMKKDILNYINMRYIEKINLRKNCEKALNYLGEYYKRVLN